MSGSTATTNLGWCDIVHSAVLIYGLPDDSATVGTAAGEAADFLTVFGLCDFLGCSGGLGGDGGLGGEGDGGMGELGDGSKVTPKIACGASMN